MRASWEYCMLMQGESMGKRLGMGGGDLVFRRFGLDGYVQNSRIGSGDNEDLLAKTVALLGHNGWELVSVSAELQPGASFSGTRWVFKRPYAGGDEARDALTGVQEGDTAEDQAGDSTEEDSPAASVEEVGIEGETLEQESGDAGQATP